MSRDETIKMNTKVVDVVTESVARVIRNFKRMD